MSRLGKSVMLANVSRRHFLRGLAAGSAFVMAARWGLATADETADTADKKYGAEAMPGGWVDNPNVFIRVDGDGTVTLTNHRAEMGQGIRTSLALVAADELGADWDRVRVEQADADEDKYGNQNTDGSRSMRHWYEPMRRAAAGARLMLEQAAANEWGVPLEEVETREHVVVHKNSDRSLGFGELAAAARELEVPDRDQLALKPDSQLRYIGRETGLINGDMKNRDIRPPAIDGEDVVTGEARFGADVQLDNMLYAVIARPPVLGARIKSVDASAARSVPGVVETVNLEGTGMPAAFSPLGGVAVVADNTWVAIKGRDALEIEWDLEAAGDNADYTSDDYRQMLEERAETAGKIIRESGDIKKALTEADKTVTATYYMPHMAQAPMEPPVAIVQFNGDTAEVWAPVQHPRAAREGVAGVLGLDLEKVTVHQTLLGGGFGRKSKPDFVIEAARLASQFEGRPVRVQWTREDDIHHAYFHAVSVDRLEAALDSDGKAIGWLHRTLSPSIGSLFAEDPRQKADFELGMGFNTMPFSIPAIRLENPQAPAHTRIGWFRSVYNLPHAWAIQSFAAEMAEAAGRDHRDYLLELLGEPRQINPREFEDGWNYGENPEVYPIDIGRMRAVVERATREASWDDKDRGERRGLGLAMHHSFVSYTAIVMDVEVTGDGEVIVHRADIAFDCGKAVNPERVRSQLEGALVMGIGIALHTEVSFNNGEAEQSNFDRYLIPRMENAPRELHVHLVDGGEDAPMGGVGEPGLPPVAPALCNAIHAAIGKRIRRLPVGSQLV